MKKLNQTIQRISISSKFNKNGLWIKEELSETKRIISAERPEGFN